MSMSDTAEYWHDIKNRQPYSGKHFVHIPESTCEHINPSTGNTDTSEYLADINCYACLKLIQDNGNIYGLKEGVSRRQQSAIDKEKHRFRNGKCKCGSAMVIRENKSTNKQFLGCINYPSCKNTAPIPQPPKQ